MSLLDSIDSPADLKRLSVEALPTLAGEIRERILAVTSAAGGHLASNLGVVELTLSLHYLLDTPKDKIVWDTSNQAYTHKLVTGRRRAVSYPPSVRRNERILQERGEHLRYLQCRTRRDRGVCRRGDDGGARPWRSKITG